MKILKQVALKLIPQLMPYIVEAKIGKVLIKQYSDLLINLITCITNEKLKVESFLIKALWEWSAWPGGAITSGWRSRQTSPKQQSYGRAPCIDSNWAGPKELGLAPSTKPLIVKLAAIIWAVDWDEPISEPRPTRQPGRGRYGIASLCLRRLEPWRSATS